MGASNAYEYYDITMLLPPYKSEGMCVRYTFDKYIFVHGYFVFKINDFKFATDSTQGNFNGCIFRVCLGTQVQMMRFQSPVMLPLSWMCSDQKHHHRLNQVVLGLFLQHGGLDEHQRPHEQPIFMCNTNITNVHTRKVSWNGDLISATLVHG